MRPKATKASIAVNPGLKSETWGTLISDLGHPPIGGKNLK